MLVNFPVKDLDLIKSTFQNSDDMSVEEYIEMGKKYVDTQRTITSRLLARAGTAPE